MGIKLEKGTIIGQGRDAEVLYWGKNQVLKLFREDRSKTFVEFEIKTGELVQKHYNYAPKVFGKIKINIREGILYEFIDGNNMSEEILKNPLKIRKFAQLLAKLHVEMHKQRIPDIRSQKAYFEQRIKGEQLLNKTQKQIIINHLRNLESGSILCHGDFHLENVLLSKKGPSVIDWSNLTAGNPHADISRTLYILKHGHDPSSSERSSLLNFLINFFRFYFVKKYFRSYKRQAKVSLKQVRKWNLIIYAVRLGEEIREEQDYLLKAINVEIKKLYHNKKNKAI